MPNISTGSVGFGESLLNVLSAGVAAAPGIIGAFRGGSNTVAAPGGAPLMVQQASTGSVLPGLQIPFTGTTLGGGGFSSNASALARSPFRPTMQGASAKIFQMENPMTGKPTWFGPLGRPILWSRDLTVCKRVKRVGAKARRFSGGRR